MVHSVELTLDADSDARVREVWSAITAAGVRSQAANPSPSNRPHTTVTVSTTLAGAVDAELATLLDRLPLPCRLGAPMVFGRGPFTLVLLVVPSAALLELHAEIARVCLGHMDSGPLPHTLPGQWTPHVTVARRLDAQALSRALAVVSTGVDITGEFAGLRRWDGDARHEYPIC